MKVHNQRPYALRLHATNQLANPGEPIEVPTALGKALCEQPANWSVKKPTKSKTKKNPSEED